MEGVSFLGEGNSVPGGAQTSRPGNPSPEKRFTGRICSLPRIRLQENVLGTLGGAGGSSKGTWTPTHLGGGRVDLPADRRGSPTLEGAQRAQGPGAALPLCLDLGPGRPGRAWWLRPSGRAQGRVRRPSGSGEEPGPPQRPDAHARPRAAFSASQHPSSQHCTPLSN